MRTESTSAGSSPRALAYLAASARSTSSWNHRMGNSNRPHEKLSFAPEPSPLWIHSAAAMSSRSKTFSWMRRQVLSQCGAPVVRVGVGGDDHRVGEERLVDGEREERDARHPVGVEDEHRVREEEVRERQHVAEAPRSRGRRRAPLEALAGDRRADVRREGVGEVHVVEEEPVDRVAVEALDVVAVEERVDDELPVEAPPTCTVRNATSRARPKLVELAGERAEEGADVDRRAAPSGTTQTKPARSSTATGTRPRSHVAREPLGVRDVHERAVEPVASSRGSRRRTPSCSRTARRRGARRGGGTR